MYSILREQQRAPRSNLLSARKPYLFHIFFQDSGKWRGLLPFLFTLTLLAACIIPAAGCKSKDPEKQFKELMSSATEYKKQEKYNEARIQLQNAIEIKPKSSQAYFELAEVLIRLQKVRQAIESYNTSINYDPTHRQSRIHLASILLAGKQYELAENHIRHLLDRDPKDIEALILQANLEGSGPRKKTEKAIQILESVLQREPENVSALASLAHLKLVSGNPKEAEELFSKAAAIEPDSAPLQMALADLYARQGRLDEAQSSLENLVEKNPEESTLRYMFGEFLLRRGLGEEALTQYIETLKGSPRRHDARDRLYDMYLTRGKIEEAKQLTASLIKAFPNDPGVHYFKGRDAQLDRKDEDALNFFLETIKLLNNFSPAFRRAGLMEIELGKTREGIEHLNQAIAIDPGDVAARLALARHMFARREFSQSTEHLNQILQRYPRQLGANILRADIAMLEGETTKARMVYEFLIKAFPNQPAGYFKLGLLEEKEKNYDEAIRWYRKTLEFDRGVVPPCRRLIALLNSHKKQDLDSLIKEIETLKAQSKKSKAEYNLLLGSLTLAKRDDPQRFDKAKALFHTAIEEKPGLIGAYYALGAIDSVSGDLKGAAENYEKLLKKSPKHIPTRMLLALTKEKLGDFEGSANEYRAILKLAPRFGPAANNLAWLLVEELDGDLDQALRLAEIAKEQLPKESSVADTLGWVHFRRGSKRAALPLIEEALELHSNTADNRPPNPEILYHLAAVQAALGDKTEAANNIKKAIDLAGDSHPKHKKMKQLQASLGK